MSNNIQVIIFITFILLCLIVAVILYRKFMFFKKFKVIPTLVLGSFASVILHNLVYGLFKIYFDSHGGDEPFFFILTFLLLGTAFFLSLIQLINFIQQKIKK